MSAAAIVECVTAHERRRTAGGFVPEIAGGGLSPAAAGCGLLGRQPYRGARSRRPRAAGHRLAAALGGGACPHRHICLAAGAGRLAEAQGQRRRDDVPGFGGGCGVRHPAVRGPAVYDGAEHGRGRLGLAGLHRGGELPAVPRRPGAEPALRRAHLAAGRARDREPARSGAAGKPQLQQRRHHHHRQHGVLGDLLRVPQAASARAPHELPVRPCRGIDCRRRAVRGLGILGGLSSAPRRADDRGRALRGAVHEHPRLRRLEPRHRHRRARRGRARSCTPSRCLPPCSPPPSSASG